MFLPTCWIIISSTEEYILSYSSVSCIRPQGLLWHNVQIQKVFDLLESEVDEHRIYNAVGNILRVFAGYLKFYEYHWKADNT